MAVESTHPDYDKNLPNWNMVSDCVSGSKTVKKRTGGTGNGLSNSLYSMAGARYLPPPNADDNSAANRARFAAYRDRANYVNFTGSTKEGMLGMVMRKKPEFVLPAQIEYLENNATGGGLTLSQLARQVTGEVLEKARDGLLIDYPEAVDGLTVAQVQEMNLQASIVPYKAECIINWQTAVVYGRKMLTLVVLLESAEIAEDKYTNKKEKQYRVLSLEGGMYVQRLFNEKGENITSNITADGADIDFIAPRMFDGSYWTEIPFLFVGAENNDENVDKSPLIDIAEVNLAHYRNSADFEESSFITGQATPVFTGLSQSWVDKVMKNGIHFGSRAGILLPAGADGKLLQANENTLPSKGMEMKERQIVQIGARLITDAGGAETAEAARIRYAGQNSKLGNIVNNVEEALEKALFFAYLFMAPPVDNYEEAGIEVEINKEFYEKTIDPQTVMADIALLDRGVIAKTDVRDNLRKAGKLNRPDDEIEGEAESTSPLE